ncbi:MAG: lipopolysaccharide heptosyltransferase II [Candidatus Omnitrophica bacterium]|nr:lipopolysaccharide heptosyltransferase II [Candidatus Omnitrophota bacterium]
MKPKRILLIRTDRIGDVALSTPAIKAVRDSYPDSYIAFMVKPYAEDIAAGNPYLNEVIIYDKDGAHNSFFATLLFGIGLRKKKFDTVVILHPTNRSHIIAFLAGIPNRIGFDKKMAFLLTKRVSDKKFLGEKHELDYTLDILRSIGVTPKDRNLFVPVKSSHENAIAIKLAREGYNGSDLLLAVHPGASCPSKKWPAERFAGLIDRLSKDYDFRIVVVAGPDDASVVARMKKNLKSNVIDLSGKTSVGELAALFKRCCLFISNDSGPVHIASAVGTPCIVIFGRKQPGLSPRRWGPTGKNDIVLHKDAGCTVCLAHNCKNGFKCLQAVTVDDVFEAVKRVLGDVPISY